MQAVAPPEKEKSPNKPVEASQFWGSHNSAAATDVDSTAGASGCFVAELRGCGAKILKSAAAKLQKRGPRWPHCKRLPAPPPLHRDRRDAAKRRARGELTGFCCSGGPSTDARSLAYFAVLCANHNNPNAEADTADLQAAANALSRQLLVLTASSDDEIEAAFTTAATHGVGALFVNIDPFFFSRREQFATLAARYGVPTIYPLRDHVAAGGLMSYGANFANAWRQSGAYVGRILKGAKPGDLPVLQPTKIELVINLKTAKALGFDIPAELLTLADEVIE